MSQTSADIIPHDVLPVSDQVLVRVGRSALSVADQLYKAPFLSSRFRPNTDDISECEVPFYL